MLDNLPDMTRYLDSAVRDVTMKIARLNLTTISPAEFRAGDTSSLVSKVDGDYSMILVFCADAHVLYAITRSMKHGEPCDEQDVEIYMREFFNILCGRIVSMLNNDTHSSSRFNIPQLLKGSYLEGAGESGAMVELYYDSGVGPFGMQSVGRACAGTK